MYKSKKSKACDIPLKVKNIVWSRDNKRCICCGNSNASPVCHFIPRSKLGLGIEENIVTLCSVCHRNFDQTANRPEYREYIKCYLKSKYLNWNEEKLVYRKYNNEF